MIAVQLFTQYLIAPLGEITSHNNVVGVFLFGKDSLVPLIHNNPSGHGALILILIIPKEHTL